MLSSDIAHKVLQTGWLSVILAINLSQMMIPYAYIQLTDDALRLCNHISMGSKGQPRLRSKQGDVAKHADILKT